MHPVDSSQSHGPHESSSFSYNDKGVNYANIQLALPNSFRFHLEALLDYQNKESMTTVEKVDRVLHSGALMCVGIRGFSNRVRRMSINKGGLCSLHQIDRFRMPIQLTTAGFNIASSFTSCLVKQQQNKYSRIDALKFLGTASSEIGHTALSYFEINDLQDLDERIVFLRKSAIGMEYFGEGLMTTTSAWESFSPHLRKFRPLERNVSVRSSSVTSSQKNPEIRGSRTREIAVKNSSYNWVQVILNGITDIPHDPSFYGV